MNITLSPWMCDDELVVVKMGDVLTVNGEKFDFSPMVDGDTLPDGAVNSRWIVGQVDRIGSVLNLTLRIPLPANYSQEQAFPAPMLNVPDGVLVLPAPLPTPAAEPEIAPPIEAEQTGDAE